MKLLIVEDEHKIAHAIKQGFEQEKFVVDVVYDGTSGLDMASMESYDAIILDRMLPEMDGLEIVQALRKQGNHTPILLLTAKGQLDEKVEGLETGADDYLTKPFAFSELLARVRALLRRPKQTVNKLLSIDNLVVDPTIFSVRRAGKSIHLTNKEFTLLVFLLRHKHTIMTKEQIVNHVWSYDADVLPNSVEVYIKHLRKKIDDPVLGKPLIHTIRGFGYKMDAGV